MHQRDHILGRLRLTCLHGAFVVTGWTSRRRRPQKGIAASHRPLALCIAAAHRLETGLLDGRQARYLRVAHGGPHRAEAAHIVTRLLSPI